AIDCIAEQLRHAFPLPRVLGANRGNGHHGDDQVQGAQGRVEHGATHFFNSAAGSTGMAWAPRTGTMNPANAFTLRVILAFSSLPPVRSILRVGTNLLSIPST